MPPDMTIWDRLAIPFPDDEVKQRPGAAKYDHKPNCDGPKCRDTRDSNKHVQFSYIDARAVAQRLDDVLTPACWTFESSVIPGSDVVHGRLNVHSGESYVWREDYGYPNSERDDEPIKAAASDALKRCAVLFGIGRHLYEDNKPGHKTPQNGHSAPRPVPVAPRSSTAIPDDIGDLNWDHMLPAKPVARDTPVAIAERPLSAGEGLCPVHGIPWELKPGGTSKATGKAYGAFFACGSSERPFCKEKPTAQWIKANHP